MQQNFCLCLLGLQFEDEFIYESRGESFPLRYESLQMKVGICDRGASTSNIRVHFLHPLHSVITVYIENCRNMKFVNVEKIYF